MFLFLPEKKTIPELELLATVTALKLMHGTCTALFYFLFDFPGFIILKDEIVLHENSVLEERREYILNCFSLWLSLMIYTCTLALLGQAFSVEPFPVAFSKNPDRVEKKRILF